MAAGTGARFQSQKANRRMAGAPPARQSSWGIHAAGGFRAICVEGCNDRAASRRKCCCAKTPLCRIIPTLPMWTCRSTLLCVTTTPKCIEARGSDRSAPCLPATERSVACRQKCRSAVNTFWANQQSPRLGDALPARLVEHAEGRAQASFPREAQREPTVQQRPSQARGAATCKSLREQ